MAAADRVAALYQELADWYEERGQAQMRDRFLVLAADAALAAGRPEEAERLRQRLLSQNPHHLLRPYPTLAEALKAPDVANYVGDLRKSYGPEAAQHLLDSLRANPEPPPTPPASPAPAPPTRPTVLSRPPAPPPESPEVLKFYRVQGEKEEEVPKPIAQRQLPVTQPLPRPVVPPPPPKSKPPVPEAAPPSRKVAPKPARPPAPSPRAPEPLPPTGPAGPSEEYERDLAAGFWISSGLFVLTLLGGLALAVYTLARPFLPGEWFR